MMGREVFKNITTEQRFTIHTSDFYNGGYFLQVYKIEGNLLLTRQIVK